jgi:uncharacterized protein (TIGR02145 family)
MKKTIYLIAGVLLLFSCKKESSNPTSNTTNSTNNPTSIAKYGNGVTDIDGNKYKTTIIGTQEWMAENLKVSKFNDGTLITNCTNNNQGYLLKTGTYVEYANEESSFKYGKLYNWYATNPTSNNGKNVCPTGWHVPTDAEWTILTDFLGGSKIAGGKMKQADTTNWSYPNVGATNTSLFTGLPGGYALGSGGYYGHTKSWGAWWSSTFSNDEMSWMRSLGNGSSSVVRSTQSNGNNLSIRCLKD